MVDDRAAIEKDDPGAADASRDRLVRRVVWAACVIGIALFAALARVDTYLGVEAPRWDKRGDEYVWRVWWRARDDLIEVSPGWLLDIGLIAAAVLFFAFMAIGLWLLLVSDRTDGPPNEPVFGLRPEIAGGSESSGV